MLPYFVPFIVASILTGIWSLQITSRMMARYLPDHAIMPKYFAIQLVLVLYKFQPILIRFGLSGLEMVFGLQLIPSKIIENGTNLSQHATSLEVIFTFKNQSIFYWFVCHIFLFHFPLTASIQLLVLLETVCLQFFANRFYMTPIKTIEHIPNLWYSSFTSCENCTINFLCRNHTITLKLSIFVRSEINRVLILFRTQILNFF